MSDKHAPSGGTAQQPQQPQWNKPTLKPAHIASQLTAGHLYDPASGLPLYGGLTPSTSASAVDGLPPYAAARFQAPPPILNHTPQQPQQPLEPHQLQPGAPAAVPLAVPPPSTTTTTPIGFFPNVPAHPGGFVAPPFPPAATATAPPNPNPTPNPFPVTNPGVLQYPPYPPAGSNVPLSLTANTSGQPASTPAALSPASVRQHVGSVDQCSGAITATITENVLKAMGVPTGTAGGSATTGRFLNMGVKPPDPDKLRRIHEMVEASVSEHAKVQITQVLERVATLKPIERLLLYLRLPGEAPGTDPLRQPQNPLGTRSEINHTINWVRSHLQHDPQVSIPKQDVYDDYTTYCERMDIKPLSTADFGKVMKQVFPGIRPRRLGTRGHSRYCYAAMRKTTSLPAPQLPHLQTIASEAIAGDEKVDCGSAESPWTVVKEWAEQMLNVKVTSVQELAERIRSTPSSRAGGPKKYTPREPKEKRTPTDMGPLKKRRKKKRKGSSSSESSVGQMRQFTNNNNNNNIEEANKTATCQPSVEQTEVKVKEELIESPQLQKSQSATDRFVLGVPGETMPMNLAKVAHSPSAASLYAAGGAEPTLGHPGVRNLTPHILALPSSQPVAGVIEAVATGAALPLASPLTPQSIKEEIVDDYNPNIICKKVRKAQQTKGFWQTSAAANVTTAGVSEGGPEVIVTAAATPPPPTVVVTAPTVIATGPAAVSPISNNYLMGPPAQLGTHLSTSPSNLSVDPGNGNGNGNTSSGSSSSSSSGGNGHYTPRVVSRNMLQLMAKRAAAIVAAASASNAAASAAGDGNGSGSDPAVPAADLPGDLGLPRERVISICNMDKHELDEYLPETVGDVGENSQDQDAELLQYFQVGDAEGKLNSLDAAKQNRTPTTTAVAVRRTPITTTTTASAETPTSMSSSKPSNDDEVLVAVPEKRKFHDETVKSPEQAKPFDQRGTTTTTTTTTTTPVTSSRSMSAYRRGTTTTTTTTKTSSIPLVGSASASLTLMSQKHQEQEKQLRLQSQQQQQPNQTITTTTTTTTAQGNKRRINKLLCFSRPGLTTDTFVVRKNSTFLPISPNINSTPSTPGPLWSSGGYPNRGASASMPPTNGGYFASPDLSRLRAKPSFGKQQSLDFDPMIGAGTHQPQRHIATTARLAYNNSSSATTSASAPPSPSVLHQQQQQQQNAIASFFRNPSHGQVPPPSLGTAPTTPPPNDHNSMDLDLYVGDSEQSYAFPGLDADDGNILINETQRSRSVPLSQLQRRLSPDFNRSFPASAAPYSSACTSVAPTPVPGDFGDSTFYSESSNSQQSIANMGGDPRDLAELGIIQADSIMLDDMDMSEILGSTDFDTKFTSLSHGPNAATTTCSSSSAGSSSGYSSVTRSVPSTPLPHHRQNLFGRNATGHAGVRRLLQDDDDAAAAPAQKHSPSITSIKYSANFSGRTTASLSMGCGALAYGSRCMYDNSKSMPATPIATPSFRYSPTNILINGNTLDSFTASISALSGDGTCDPDMIINTLHGEGAGGDSLAGEGNRSTSPFASVAHELLENL